MAANLRTEVEQYIKAGMPAIWVQSQEHEEAIQRILELCKDKNWEVAHWDADRGLMGSKLISDQRTADSKKEPSWYPAPLPLIRDAEKIADKTKAQRTVIILKGLHRREYIENSAILQALLNSVAIGKASDHGWCFIIMAPTINIPVEWDNTFVVVNHELPDKEQLWEIAAGIAHKNELPKDADAKQAVLDAAIGMTRRAAEDAFSLSIVKKRPFDPAVVQSLKAQAIKRKGLLSLWEGDDSFSDLGGLEHFKQFSMKLLGGKKRHNPLLYPKGLLLLGVPGSGKSAAVKCLGTATGRPVLTLDVGSLRSKFQGETDHNIRDALKIADAMSPAILFIDEIEKALSGVQSSGLTDGGTGARVFGTLLTWLNDHKSDVFFVGTCNNIQQLMSGNPEFARAERFDGMFFFDMPSADEREAIWNIYLKMFDIKKHPAMDKLVAMSEGWTGAEIRSCCRLSAILEEPIEETAKTIVPIVQTAGESLEALRSWADGRCMSSSVPGLFRKDKDDAKIVPTAMGRKLTRD